MNRQGRLISVFSGLLCALLGSLLLSVPAFGQTEHPHYLHALADLRTARAWITEPVHDKAMGKEADAVAYIDKAFAEIRRASIDDGKDLKDHDAIDVTTTKHTGRLHKAWDLLKSANKDLHMKEDDKKELGWRTAAIRNVDQAMRSTGEAIKDVKERP